MGPMIKFADNLLLKVENETKAADVLAMYLRNKESFEMYEPTRPEGFYTQGFHEVALRREYLSYQLGTFLRYYIYLFPDDKKIIGAINFNFYSHNNESYVEVGYKVDYDYRNIGVAYSACLAGFKVIREDYGINRVDARIHPNNKASLRLVEKLGFKFVQLEEQSAHVNGRYVDLFRYSLDISDIQ